MKPVRLWVDGKFKKKLKKIALDEDTSILQLTKDLAGDELEEKRGKFDFRL